MAMTPLTFQDLLCLYQLSIHTCFHHMERWSF